MSNPSISPIPSRKRCERRLDDEAYAELERRDHHLDIYRDSDLGHVAAATRENGLLRASTGPRAIHHHAAGG